MSDKNWMSMVRSDKTRGWWCISIDHQSFFDSGMAPCFYSIITVTFHISNARRPGIDQEYRKLELNQPVRVPRPWLAYQSLHILGMHGVILKSIGQKSLSPRSLAVQCLIFVFGPAALNRKEIRAPRESFPSQFESRSRNESYRSCPQPSYDKFRHKWTLLFPRPA